MTFTSISAIIIIESEGRRERKKSHRARQKKPQNHQNPTWDKGTKRGTNTRRGTKGLRERVPEEQGKAAEYGGAQPEQKEIEMRQEIDEQGRVLVPVRVEPLEIKRELEAQVDEELETSESAPIPQRWFV